MISLFRTFGFDAPSKTESKVSERSQPGSQTPSPDHRFLLDCGAPKPVIDEEQVMLRRRSEALRTMFPKLFSWFANHWDLDAVTEVNSYLEQSTNLVDLERRIRNLEQKRHFGL